MRQKQLKFDRNVEFKNENFLYAILDELKINGVDLGDRSIFPAAQL